VASGGKSRKPAAVVRRGAISASIWRNKTKGKYWYSVSLQRCYKDDDGEFAYSETLNLHDLLHGARVLQLAWDAIYKLHEADKDAEQSGDGKDDGDKDEAGKSKGKDNGKSDKDAGAKGKDDDGDDEPEGDAIPF
jgi:hypothetical protein